MKAAVMSIEGKEAIIIDEQGNISTIEDHGFSVGEELELDIETKSITDKVMIFARKNMPVIAAAAAFVVMLSGGMGYANCHACSTVTLDINPSLKYSLNLFDKVIEVDSFNNDGEEIAVQIADSAKGKTLENVVSLTLDELDRTGYVGEDTSVVVTLGSRFDSEEKLEGEVVESVRKWNDVKSEEGETKSINVETVRVTPEMADMAIEKGVSPGKIYIVGKLKEQVLEDVEFDEDEWLTKSVSEIREATATASDPSVKISSLSEDRSEKTQAKTSASASTGSAGSDTPKTEKVADSSKKDTKKKKSKKKAASGNGALSADEVGDTVSDGGEGGTSLSGNTAGVSGNIALPEDPLPLIQPTVSSQPEIEVPIPEVPDQTETGIPETFDVTLVDQPNPASSYLEGPQASDVKCDDVPSED